MTQKMFIGIYGCDDSTEITMDVPRDAIPRLQALCSAVNEIGGGCQPTMKVSDKNPYGDRDLTHFDEDGKSL